MFNVGLFHLNCRIFILLPVVKAQQILALVKRQFELLFIFAVHILVDGDALIALRFQERAHAAFGEAVLIDKLAVDGVKHFAVVEFPIGDVVFDELRARQATSGIHARKVDVNMFYRIVEYNRFTDRHGINKVVIGG